MNKKIIIPLAVVVVVIITASVVLSKSNNVSSEKNIVSQQDRSQKDAISTGDSNAPLKEFSMTSFTEMVNGEPRPQFSLKEITVNKGDRVRIKITETSGMHNFNIDEFGVYTETPLNKESVVEFIADKSGSFVYYCSKPGHRQNGHWGTLKVI